ncbi:MAG: HyaD/HybD family hydrogenase maturation endopeptidase [Magnetovibrio sp.]|nr:HyaD/HybD family hydrogenase maturation endopeptidase [Magnetovibrio sp.]
MMTSKETILVLGLGNILLTDEAVGVRTVEKLESHPALPKSGVKTMDGGTMGISLMVNMEDADALIVVDAAVLNQHAGAVEVFEGEAMDHFLRTRGRSPHDIGLDDIMDGLRLREAVPHKRALVGIQPQDMTVGESLTPEVEAGVPIAVEAILSIIKDWNNV